MGLPVDMNVPGPSAAGAADCSLRVMNRQGIRCVSADGLLDKPAKSMELLSGLTGTFSHPGRLAADSLAIQAENSTAAENAVRDARIATQTISCGREARRAVCGGKAGQEQG